MTDRQSTMPGYCERHDLRYDSHGCPVCVIDKYDDPRRPISAEEEAVVEKAKEYLSLFERSNPYKAADARERLFDAVRTLTAPKAVRPETVPLGTRFRFAPDTEDEPQRPAEWTLRKFMGDTPYDPRVCAQHDNGEVMLFDTEDRIIPIPEED